MSQNAAYVLTPVSVGELADKLTILQIKSERIAEPAKLANIRTEIASLEPLWLDVLKTHADLDALRVELKVINERMWDVQDALRAKESAQTFDAQFIQLARDVGRHNGDRMQVKNQINQRSGSSIQEVKQYQVDG
ncbi:MULTISPECIES: DUF6165 family protein [Dyella]|uniref:Uncharacterized protein n=2 Tax=Dyella TaxID=231454 RepID=A0A4R0YPI2_9GAMM|nr:MULTISPECIES: DUF6165 family protein [Dyella]TBR36457.1 hypothetical protein EYV96_10960 [Dyella terrae]TCI08451.1 hypothetical protein EZM97_27910 [Dyella soli]